MYKCRENRITNRVVIPLSDSQRIPKHQSTIATPSLAAKAKRHQNDVQAQTALKGIESGKSIIQKLFQTEWVRLAGICVIFMSLSFLQTKTKTY